MLSKDKSAIKQGNNSRTKKVSLDTIEDKASEENALRTTESKRHAAQSAAAINDEPTLSDKSYSTKEVSG